MEFLLALALLAGWVVLWLKLARYVKKLATEKGLDPGGYYLLALLIGVFALPVVLLATPNGPVGAQRAAQAEAPVVVEPAPAPLPERDETLGGNAPKPRYTAADYRRASARRNDS